MIGPAFVSHPASPASSFVAAATLACLGVVAARALPGFALLLVVAAFLPAGTGRALLRAGVSPPPLDDGEALVEGQVAAPPFIDGARAVFVLELQYVTIENRVFRSTARVRLTSNSTLKVLAGDHLLLPVRLTAPERPANPGAVNGERRNWAEGVAAVGRVDASRVVVLGDGDPLSLRIGRARERYRSLCEAAVEDARAASLIRALALGDRCELGEATETDFRSSGLAHILSVSGLHIAVVAAGLYLALRRLLALSEWILLNADLRALASAAAIPATWAYIVATGSEVPAVRSGIMTSALFLSRVVRRDSDGLTSLGLALLAVLSVDPAAIHSPAFQLSFAAVAGLVLLVRPLRTLMPVPAPDHQVTGVRLLWQRAREATLLAGAVSLAATLATAPLLAAHFQRVSLAGLVANVLAVPVASSLTALSALSALAFGLWEELAVPFILFAEPLARLLLAIGSIFAAIPYSNLSVAAPSPTLVALWFGLLASLALRGERPLLARRLALLSIAGLIAVLAYRVGRPYFSRELSVTFLAVGQGDATIVRFPDGKSLLVDGGGSPGSPFDTGTRIVMPALLELGVRRLDAMALSHPHPDHALGLLSVLGLLPVGEVWTAFEAERNGLLRALETTARERGVTVRELAGPRAIDGFEPAVVEVLHPAGTDPARSVNDGSLVLRLSLGEVSFLFPGDLEREGEEELVQRASPLATVLKAPHHGSRTSSTDALIRAVRPHHVVFCVGKRNRFGFPHDAVVERYEAAHCRIHRTDRDGAVTFRTDGRTLEVEHFLR